MNEIPGLTEAARKIRAKKILPSALLEQCVSRIEALDGMLNAFVTPLIEAARTEARTADREILAGRWRGPLHGIPVGIKDVIDVEGVATMAQSRQLEGYVPTKSAVVVRKLVEAGAIIVGKLTTHEFAFGTPTWGPPGPPARNPWNPDRFAGGSSSGAAVATATGMVLGAVGTDTAGSVRSPAALCGVAGLKPSQSRVDRRGVFPLSPSLDAVGAFGWTVEDCASVYRAMSSSAGSRRSSSEPFPALDTDLRGIRIGVIRHFFSKDAPISSDGITAIDEAIEVFRSRGCRIRNVALPPLEEWNAVGMILLLSEAFAFHEPWLRERIHLYGESLRDALLLGGLIDAADYVQANSKRLRLAEALDIVFKDNDILISAIQSGEAAPLESVEKWGFIEKPSYGIPFNVSDHPALSVCCGFGRQGLPLALQLVGRRNDEALLLRAGHAYECAAGWQEHRPAPRLPTAAVV
ncbi:MAG: amidase [Proteobacteria bacterium]|nr:amidase [Pseudomonadota bacterium]